MWVRRTPGRAETINRAFGHRRRTCFRWRTVAVGKRFGAGGWGLAVIFTGHGRPAFTESVWRRPTPARRESDRRCRRRVTEAESSAASLSPPARIPARLPDPVPGFEANRTAPVSQLPCSRLRHRRLRGLLDVIIAPLPDHRTFAHQDKELPQDIIPLPPINDMAYTLIFISEHHLFQVERVFSRSSLQHLDPHHHIYSTHHQPLHHPKPQPGTGQSIVFDIFIKTLQNQKIYESSSFFLTTLSDSKKIYLFCDKLLSLELFSFILYPKFKINHICKRRSSFKHWTK